MQIERRPADERIWEQELASWIPARIFDAHTHIFRAQDCLLTPDDPDMPRPAYVDEIGTIDLAEVRRVDRILLPGRRTEYLLVACPWLKFDWEGQTAFMAEQAGGKATDGETRIMGKVPAALHERTPLIIGSEQEVDRVQAYLHGQL